MKIMLLSVFILLLLNGCAKNSIYLVGEIEEDFTSKPKVYKYENITVYPKELNRFSKEL